MKEPIQWRNEKRKVKDLIPFEGNPRKISKQNAEELKKSLERFGLADLPIAQPDGTLIGGHQRVAILKASGHGDQEIEVRIPSRNLSSGEFQELNIRLNKNQGEWDWDELANFDLNTLLEAGFTKEEVSHKFTIDVSEDEFNADEEYKKIKEAKAKPGDIYQLGRHRLMCGDSTDSAAVEKLMGGVQADMVFTDPPYGVSYSDSKFDHTGKTKKDVMKNDEMTGQNLREFLTKAFTNIALVSKPGTVFYSCYASVNVREFRDAYEAAGFHYSQDIIWLKQHMVPTMRQDYHWCEEPIIFGWKNGKHYRDKMIKKEKQVWDLDFMAFQERLDVWWLSKDKNYVHPTQKPLKLIERALKRSSKLDDVLYEPFSGSGSTLIACEQAERSCRAMELDPRYVDVAILRWEQLTGLKAEKLV